MVEPKAAMCYSFVANISGGAVYKYLAFCTDCVLPILALKNVAFPFLLNSYGTGRTIIGCDYPFGPSFVAIAHP
jgi:hypothetical protein